MAGSGSSCCVLTPHIGILLLSFRQDLELQRSARRIHAAALWNGIRRFARMIWNTVLYCGLAALLDVTSAQRSPTSFCARDCPAEFARFMASAALAIPGSCLPSATCAPFAGSSSRLGGAPHVIRDTARHRVCDTPSPYALRACRCPASAHVSLEEAAENLGATSGAPSRVSSYRSWRCMLAGFVTSFMTAAVYLSATIMLTTSQSDAPMSYGIYL